MDGEDELLDAAIAFDDAGVADADQAGGVAADEVLAGIDRAEAVVGGALPGEILVDGAGAGQLEREAERSAAALRNADILAGQAGGRAVGGGDHAFIGEELDDVAVGVDQGDAVEQAVLDAVGGVGESERAVAVVLVRDDAAQAANIVRWPRRDRCCRCRGRAASR